MSSSFEVLEVTKQLRYSVSSKEKGKAMLVAFHGYGQLIEFFSKKFSALNSDITVVCPEGMHRFYLEGTSGRVGASWMTKEWREQDILENNRSIDLLVSRLKNELEPKKIIIFGFSQGVATAARWIASTTVKIDEFIAWAGVFPPDIQLPERNIFPEKKTAVVGKQDPYIQMDQYKLFRSKYEKFGFRMVEFDEKHEIVPDLLKELIEHE